jgi:uncharacterized protein YndB with AHSA1/START domain
MRNQRRAIWMKEPPNEVFRALLTLDGMRPEKMYRCVVVDARMAAYAGTGENRDLARKDGGMSTPWRRRIRSVANADAQYDEGPL